jgi:hypothetical protein
MEGEIIKGVENVCDICQKACKWYRKCVACERYFHKDTMTVSREGRHCLNCTNQGFHRIEVPMG